jgi:hypothetical protein
VTLLGVFTGPRPLGREGVRVLPWRRFLKALWNDELIMPG